MQYAGEVAISDPGADKPLFQGGTIQCCHCGGQWVPKPGSGIERGFCQNCNGFVCGPGCAACVNVEQLLDNIEKGRPLDFRPIIAPTSI